MSLKADVMKSIDDLLAKRNAGDEAAGYQAFVLMQKAWPEMLAEIERLRSTLQAVVTYPESQDFERDERGEIKSGARAWGPGGALRHVKQIATNALAHR